MLRASVDNSPHRANARGFVKTDNRSGMFSGELRPLVYDFVLLVFLSHLPLLLSREATALLKELLRYYLVDTFN